MARNPRDLIVETILEGYRQEKRILTGDRPDDVDADMFGELFAKAQADDKLSRHIDVPHCRDWPRCMSARACGTGRSALSASDPRRGGGKRYRRPDRRIRPQALTQVKETHDGVDFETDPEYQKELDWVDQFVRDEIEPLDLAFRICNSRRRDKRRKVIDPLKEEVAPQACGRRTWDRAGRPGLRPAEARAAQRDPRPIAVGADHVRLPAPDTGNAEIIAHYGTDEQKERYLRRCSTASCSPATR
jgi:hypothetical protein